MSPSAQFVHANQGSKQVGEHDFKISEWNLSEQGLPTRITTHTFPLSFLLFIYLLSYLDA